MIPETQLAGLADVTERLPAAQRQVVDFITAHLGVTRNELDKALGAGQPNANFSRRLTELEAKGLIHRGDPRLCNVSGRRATTWWPGPGLAATEGRPKSRREVLEEAIAGIKAQLARAAVLPDGALDNIRTIVDQVDRDDRRAA